MADRPPLPNKFGFKKHDPEYLERLRQICEWTAGVSRSLKARFPNGPDSLRLQEAEELAREQGVKIPHYIAILRPKGVDTYAFVPDAPGVSIIWPSEQRAGDLLNSQLIRHLRDLLAKGQALPEARDLEAILGSGEVRSGDLLVSMNLACSRPPVAKASADEAP